MKDNGKPLTVAFPGGTEFNFTNDVPHFDLYLDSARKFAAAAAAAGATVLMTNQSEFDNAATKLRLLKDRHPGEAAPARGRRRHGGALLQGVRGMRHGGADEAVGDGYAFGRFTCLSAAAPSPPSPASDPGRGRHAAAPMIQGSV